MSGCVCGKTKIQDLFPVSRESRHRLEKTDAVELSESYSNDLVSIVGWQAEGGAEQSWLLHLPKVPWGQATWSFVAEGHCHSVLQFQASSS